MRSQMERQNSIRIMRAVSLLLVGTTLSTSVPLPLAVSTRAQDRAFPGRLDTYLTRSVRLTDEERRKLLGGAPVTKLLDAKFGLKPTVRINHVVIAEAPEGIAVASKQIYANHYFWTALELRVLVPDPSRGQGFWFVNVNRSRSDGLSGFVGRLIRGKVQGEARSGMEAVLKVTKTTLERQAGKV